MRRILSSHAHAQVGGMAGSGATASVFTVMHTPVRLSIPYTHIIPLVAGWTATVKATRHSGSGLQVYCSIIPGLNHLLGRRITASRSDEKTICLIELRKQKYRPEGLEACLSTHHPTISQNKYPTISQNIYV